MLTAFVLFLSTQADRQAVDISVTVCFFCVFVRLRIYPPRVNLAASNFARRFIGVQDRDSPVFVNFAPPEAQNRTNRRTRHYTPRRSQRLPFGCLSHDSVDVGSACVDIRPSPKTDVLVSLSPVVCNVILDREVTVRQCV